MKEMVKVELFLYKETVDNIRKIRDYENIKNEIKDNGRSTTNELSDFITGCVNLYLRKLNGEESLAGFDDLGKPYRLKNRFKAYLKSKGLKQVELAEKTGIDPGNISIILSNRSQPSLDYFLRIWIALGRPPIENVMYREEE